MLESNPEAGGLDKPIQSGLGVMLSRIWCLVPASWLPCVESFVVACPVSWKSASIGYCCLPWFLGWAKESRHSFSWEKVRCRERESTFLCLLEETGRISLKT